MKIVSIVFGGKSAEHRESIRTTRLLYDKIQRLLQKYRFKFFYLTHNNEWTTRKASYLMISGKLPHDSDYTRHLKKEFIDNRRIIDLRNSDVIYNTMMGDCGENGNIMGLADLYGIRMIGCGILASSLCQDKYLSKILAKTDNINIVDYLFIDKHDDINKIVSKIKRTIGFPCFVKPNNLGTCSYVFKADNEKEFVKKFKDNLKYNRRSEKYLVEAYIDNTEIRVFLFEDPQDNLHTNDLYVTQLNLSYLDGADNDLFKGLKNDYPKEIRDKVCNYATRLYKLFGLKDYSRIDFFVENKTNKIYFNEINTQPFISKKNIDFMKKNDIDDFAEYFDIMIRRNLIR